MVVARLRAARADATATARRNRGRGHTASLRHTPRPRRTRPPPRSGGGFFDPARVLRTSPGRHVSPPTPPGPNDLVAEAAADYGFTGKTTPQTTTKRRRRRRNGFSGNCRARARAREHTEQPTSTARIENPVVVRRRVRSRAIRSGRFSVRFVTSTRVSIVSSPTETVCF